MYSKNHLGLAKILNSCLILCNGDVAVEKSFIKKLLKNKHQNLVMVDQFKKDIRVNESILRNNIIIDIDKNI